MGIHRGMAAVAALTLALMTAACGSDDEPDSTPTTTATPTSTASVDPGAKAVPLDGDDHLTIQWTLDKGVDDSDPVVDVARRTLAVVYLASFSPAWRSDAAISKISPYLTTGDDVLLEPTRSSRTSEQVTANDPLLIAVQPPQVSGDTAVVWACVDARGAFDREPLNKTNIGILVSVSMTATDGTWKATEYNLKPEDPTDDERYYERCQQPE